MRGTVLSLPGPNRQPYLKRIACTHPRRRAFRLCWRETPEPITGIVALEHVEPGIPDFVETLEIHMPDDSVYRIDSRRPKEPRGWKTRR